MTRIVITGLVIVHLVATLWHGDAHRQLAIGLPPEKTIFVYVVIIALLELAAALYGAFLLGSNRSQSWIRKK